MSTIESTANASAPDVVETLQEASAAISILLHQIGQMREIFGDEDESIADAVADGEGARRKVREAVAALRKAA